MQVELAKFMKLFGVKISLERGNNMDEWMPPNTCRGNDIVESNKGVLGLEATVRRIKISEGPRIGLGIPGTTSHVLRSLTGDSESLISNHDLPTYASVGTGQREMVVVNPLCGLDLVASELAARITGVGGEVVKTPRIVFTRESW